MKRLLIVWHIFSLILVPCSQTRVLPILTPGRIKFWPLSTLDSGPAGLMKTPEHQIQHDPITLHVTQTACTVVAVLGRSLKNLNVSKSANVLWRNRVHTSYPFYWQTLQVKCIAWISACHIVTLNGVPTESKWNSTMSWWVKSLKQKQSKINAKQAVSVLGSCFWVR